VKGSLKKPNVTLSNEVECDEASVIAGHKGHPEAVKKKGRKGRRRQLKGKRGRGTLEKERPPVFGMMQRGGQVVINMLAYVKQKTIEPFIKETIAPGTRVQTPPNLVVKFQCLDIVDVILRQELRLHVMHQREIKA